MALTIYPSLSACPTWIPTKPNGDGDVTIHALPDEVSKIVLKPKDLAFITIRISPFHLPPINPGSLNLSNLHLSTRSCLAQSGVFVHLSEGSRLDLNTVAALSQGKSILLPAVLENFGQSKLLIKTTDHLARFFHINIEDRLNEDQLRQLANKNCFRGVEGIDYKIHLHEGNPTIALRIDPQELYLPSTRTLRVVSRQDLYRHTSPGFHKTGAKFHLFQTHSKVYLPKNIIGVINPAMDPSTMTHLPSLLLDPGTSWKIRLETYGDLPPTDTSSWVFVSLFKSPLLKFSAKKDLASYAPCLH